MKWVDKAGNHVPKCKMLFFDDAIDESETAQHELYWESRIYAY